MTSSSPQNPLLPAGMAHRDSKAFGMALEGPQSSPSPTPSPSAQEPEAQPQRPGEGCRLPTLGAEASREERGVCPPVAHGVSRAGR